MAGLDLGDSSQLAIRIRSNEFRLINANLEEPTAALPVHDFPASVPDWDNLKILHRNTLPPRAHFFQYSSEADALAQDLSRARCVRLTGDDAPNKWKLHVSPSPLVGPVDFYENEFFMGESDNDWKTVSVPGMWQLQGLGRGPQYTNVVFPWPVDPPHVPRDDNECGRYLTTFQVPKTLDFTPGSQLRLRFEGVDSAFSVWVNGQYVGYSQGARNPSEFDVTGAVKIQDANDDRSFNLKNTLAVEVYQRCDGSYLEDQDQWWLSGIFRDVYLHSFPPVSFEDFHVKTLLDDDCQNAELVVGVQCRDNRHDGTNNVWLDKPSTLHLKLIDADGDPVAETKLSASHTSFDRGTKYWPIHASLPIETPHKWTAETPYLYTLVLSLCENEEPVYVSQKVGFRRVELINGVFSVNGQPVKIRGVNRHEHHPDSGRTVPYEWLYNDLKLMKLHNINAIRTSHYINDTRLYELANELGFWVLDEADLECHGFGEQGDDFRPNSWTSDNPDWAAAYTDRAWQMVARDKNQPCIVMWSLGNESFYGQNHQTMYDFIKRIDDTRLIHYEPDQDAETVDIFSRMYDSPDQIKEMAREKEWSKPLVLCEYAHAMGNGPGAIKEYIDAFYRFPRLMGGFVWEWANHGLRSRNEHGAEYMAYGGDFGDEPNNGHFVMDGLCFSNHTPTPGLVEYKKAIEPVQTRRLDGNDIIIINRYDFLTLDHLQCTWHVVYDRCDPTSRKTVKIPEGIQPHKKARLTIDGLEYLTAEDAQLTLSFTLREDTPWAPRGHEVAFGQLPLGERSKLALLEPTIFDSVVNSPIAKQVSSTQLSISGADGCQWIFDLAAGSITSWTQNDQRDNLVTEPLTFDVYRALTDNDSGGEFGPEWRKHRVHQAKTHTIRSSWKLQPVTGLVEVTVASRIAPPVFNWSIAIETIYSFSKSDISIRVHAKPQGAMLPKTLPRFGLRLGLAGVDEVRWFGRGPGESYRDKKMSQMFGIWTLPADQLFVDYEYPQDNGNRTDVRWVEFRGAGAAGDRRTLRAKFDDIENASFQALPYTATDLDKATHPYELADRKRKDTIVHLDWAHHGLGTGSCGPSTLVEHQLRTNQEFVFKMLLSFS
ncbi:hypothetical protein SBRCBS47491_007816 [Sporothrix bragantina]|uniref:beta-galactosidase n=1 Tax=Sporothrix bragantina TaxID=671064 RepID=A0ABP0CGR5_9PEZI